MPPPLSNLTVFGATGKTGQQLVRAALAAGHQVTAVVRDPAKLELTHERLHVARGDVLDGGSIAESVRGAEAVLSALGAANGLEPTTVYSTGTTNILQAMNRAGVQRLVTISAVPVTPREQVGIINRRLVFPILYRFVFGEGYRDMTRMERLLQASASAWTVLRPPRLTDGPATGRYRTAVNEPLRRAGKISRADLAQAMLDALENPRTLKAILTVAY
ncbi:MAG: NAD(P)-dependent oxidoreductase [Solirubrobacteraceae bacterium]